MKKFDFDHLEAELHHTDEHVRLRAVQRIILYPKFEQDQVPRFMKVLLGNLRDPSTAVRYYAKKAFARLKESLGSSELAFLVTALQDDAIDMSWENQPTFVYGTKEYWLYELSSVDFKIRVKAIIELSKTPSPLIAERLFELMGEERHEHVIATLVKYLAHFDDVRFFETVLPYLKHPDNRVRANAIEGLEIAGDRRAASHLTPLLVDPDNRVRANAAKCLMSSHPDDVASTITDMLDSEHEWMRDSALFLIGTAKPASATELLARACRDLQSDIRSKAAEMLGRLGQGKMARATLEAMLEDPIDAVQNSAKKALSALRS